MLLTSCFSFSFSEILDKAKWLQELHGRNIFCWRPQVQQSRIILHSTLQSRALADFMKNDPSPYCATLTF